MVSHSLYYTFSHFHTEIYFISYFHLFAITNKCCCEHSSCPLMHMLKTFYRDVPKSETGDHRVDSCTISKELAKSLPTWISFSNMGISPPAMFTDSFASSTLGNVRLLNVCQSLRCEVEYYSCFNLHF